MFDDETQEFREFPHPFGRSSDIFGADRIGKGQMQSGQIDLACFRQTVGQEVWVELEIHYTIVDGESGKMFIVNPEERWYVRTSREELDADVRAAAGEGRVSRDLRAPPRRRPAPPAHAPSGAEPIASGVARAKRWPLGARASRR